ncbi:hypothetical protein FRC12_009474, partial [Ceratobasidium sp. 428]
MTSYQDSSVYVRLLFGQILQAHCKNGDKWQKSLIGLNDCLFNDDGKLVSHGSKPFNFPFDPKLNVQIEGSIIKANIKNSKGERVWAQYDLRRCLYNEGGKLKWIVTDRLFDNNGSLLGALRSAPVVGNVAPFTTLTSGDAEHARQALAAATKLTFVTIVVMDITTMAGPLVGPLVAELAGAAAAAVPTIVADVTLEPLGRHWVTDFRATETTPGRAVGAIALDVALTEVSSGAASGITAFKDTSVKLPGRQSTVKTGGFLLPSRRLQD